jgi:hypothetical protein
MMGLFVGAVQPPLKVFVQRAAVLPLHQRHHPPQMPGQLEMA